MVIDGASLGASVGGAAAPAPTTSAVKLSPDSESERLGVPSGTYVPRFGDNAPYRPDQGWQGVTR